MSKQAFKKIIDKNGFIWFIGNIDPHFSIYVSTNDKNGFGGRNIEFLLEDGTKQIVKGPWHSNFEDLFKHTGYIL